MDLKNAAGDSRTYLNTIYLYIIGRNPVIFQSLLKILLYSLKYANSHL